MPKLYKKLISLQESIDYQLSAANSPESKRLGRPGVKIQSNDLEHHTTETENSALCSRMIGGANYILEIHSVRWFLSMFCVDMPLDCAKNVLDLYIIDGPIVFIRTALAIFKVLEPAIISESTLEGISGPTTS